MLGNILTNMTAAVTAVVGEMIVVEYEIDVVIVEHDVDAVVDDDQMRLLMPYHHFHLQ